MILLTVASSVALKYQDHWPTAFYVTSRLTALDKKKKIGENSAFCKQRRIPTTFRRHHNLGGSVERGGTPGATPLNKAYSFVPPQRVWFLRRFGLNTDIDFAHFGLEWGMVFEGTTGVYERISRFNSK